MSEPAAHGDTRLVVTSALAVLLVGLLIMGGLWLSLRALSHDQPCRGWTSVGYEAEIAKQAKDSPYHITVSGRCDLWATVHAGRLVAVRTTTASHTGCVVEWNEPRRSFMCGATRLGWNELRTWPSRTVRTGPRRGAWELDFGTG